MEIFSHLQMTSAMRLGIHSQLGYGFYVILKTVGTWTFIKSRKPYICRGLSSETELITQCHCVSAAWH